MIPVKTPGKILAIAMSFVTVCFFFSCKKTDTINAVIEQPADFSKKIIASVNGFVTNENNSPVAGATIQYGELFSTTDQYGYFEIKNATVTENAGVVTVKMNGYFNSIKTFIPQAGNENFCRIRLIPKTSSGSIDAASGGDVTLSNGLKVSLPPAGIVDAATKTAYSGNVNVSSFWINPVADDIDEIMPGDLRGINTNGYLKSLTSFGMAAIELTGSSGQLLQIADGKKATLTFPLPNAIAADAPATISLWYFDEVKGLWIEEGTATKSGNNYIGDVKHFTFWNCDIPSNFVSFDCTLIDTNNTALSGIKVKISEINSPNNYGFGYSNGDGLVSGFVPVNKQLVLELVEEGCTIISKEFTSSASNGKLSLGKITVPSSKLARISGLVTNCNGTPVENGNIIIQNNGKYFTYSLNNGLYNFGKIVCEENASSLIIAEDIGANKQSTPASFNLSNGTSIVHNLIACGVASQEFINFSLNGINTSITSTSASATFSHTGSTTTSNLNVLSAFEPGVNWINIGFYANNLVVGNTQIVYIFNPAQISGASTPIGQIPIYITEYGQIGQFISGHFMGEVFDPVDNINYNFTCTFRIRRAF